MNRAFGSQANRTGRAADIGPLRIGRPWADCRIGCGDAMD